MAEKKEIKPPQPKMKPAKKKELTSDRRQYKLMQVVSKVDIVKDKYDWSSSESSSEDEDEPKKPKEPRVLVVKSKYGKTRPLTETGKFSDRPAPAVPPPNAVEIVTTPVGNDAQMPYVYASNKSGVVLTRGQYLDIAEAKEKKKQREEARNRAAQEEKEILQRWMCDPRITTEWSVHYSKEYKKCYFYNKETKETSWKPPQLKVKQNFNNNNSKNSKNGKNSNEATGGGGDDGGDNQTTASQKRTGGFVKVEPKWLRNLKGGVKAIGNKVDKVLPKPPRSVQKVTRTVRFAATKVGLGSCCGPTKIEFEGACAPDAMEIVDALGLSQQDLHVGGKRQKCIYVL